MDNRSSNHQDPKSVCVQPRKRRRFKQYGVLSNQQMLRAAQRKLDEHLATRPATRDEAGAIAAEYFAQADMWQRKADQPIRPKFASEIGPGRDSPRIQREDSASCARAKKRLAACDRAAAEARLRGEIWRQENPLKNWEKTLAELQGRVDFYARLISEENASPS